MVTEHPADNRVLEAAQAGHVDYVVSGDADLLNLHRFEGIEIVRPREFLDLMEGPASSED